MDREPIGAFMANADQKQQKKQNRYRPNQEILMERCQGLHYQTLITVLIDHNGFKSTPLRDNAHLKSKLLYKSKYYTAHLCFPNILTKVTAHRKWCLSFP